MSHPPGPRQATPFSLSVGNSRRGLGRGRNECDVYGVVLRLGVVLVLLRLVVPTVVVGRGARYEKVEELQQLTVLEVRKEVR